MKILVIGESCKDVFHYGECNRLCPEAPVPVFNSTEITENEGMAKNVQRNLVSLGCDAVLHTNENWEDVTKTLEEDIEYISEQNNCTFLDTKKQLGEWCSKIKFIKINNIELEKSRKHITQEIYDKTIITHGKSGASHDNINYPVEEVEIKDTSGAGDTFLAGLVCKYLESDSIEVAIPFANLCATSVVQRKGVSTV